MLIFLYALAALRGLDKTLQIELTKKYYPSKVMHYRIGAESPRNDLEFRAKCRRSGSFVCGGPLMGWMCHIPGWLEKQVTMLRSQKSKVK